MIESNAHIPKQWPNLGLFLMGLALLSVAGGMLDVTFNNFLNDVHHLDAGRRGVLEFPRELPGFLTAFLIAGLVFLAETRIAVVAACATGLGILWMAWSGSSWATMMIGFATSAGFILAVCWWRATRFIRRRTAGDFWSFMAMSLTPWCVMLRGWDSPAMSPIACFCL